LSCAAFILLTRSCLAQESKPAFEVATVKRARPDARYAHIFRGGRGTSDPELFTVESMTPRDLISATYQVRTFQVSGSPWLERSRYDIVARVPPGATCDQFTLMPRNLLAERFNLKLHHDEDRRRIRTAGG